MFEKVILGNPLLNSGGLFAIIWSSISFPVGGSIKLMIINMP